ncbi:hypothetical protein S58_63610 [Bradyrhizobium oligotrophicum S58]|uniref:Uncharacterized protein n=1 Tax=Bradyrhizobium oligotrophicum S58 TaxID=1245469 RepID=M5A0L2_9BRAD|nr:hypothetical protein S58_63610 [Bradyrhizobium oligotrophicum S58]
MALPSQAFQRVVASATKARATTTANSGMPKRAQLPADAAGGGGAAVGAREAASAPVEDSLKTCLPASSMKV